MKRTLQTAAIGFHPLLTQNSSLKIIAWPDLRECGRRNASIGSSVQDLKEFVNGNPVDLALVTQGWEFCTDKDQKACGQRVRRVHDALWNLVVDELKKRNREKNEEDIEIAVVSHASFLRELLGEAGMYQPVISVWRLLDV